MNKSISLIAATALALSMIAPSALAESPKTAADYQDLTNLSPELQTQIDSLLAKGIFEGVSDDSFGIAQNMTRAQFAKVASLVFGLQADASLQTSGFADVTSDDPANGWAIPYIEAAKKAGMIDGMTDTTFAPGDPVTIGQLDAVLVKGLGKTVNVSATPWYEDAVKQATGLGIHPSGKAGDAPATRADLVQAAYAAWQAAHPEKEQGQAQEPVSISSVQASGDQTVEVKLSRAIDTAKPVLTLSRNGKVIDTSTIWSDDKTSATLTLLSDEKLATGSYLVTLSGPNGSAAQSVTGTLNIGATVAIGKYNYTTDSSFELSDVIDSGLTGGASGTYGNASRAEAEDPIFSKFAKEIEITVTNSAGEEVATSGIVQSVSSSNPSVVKTGVSANHKGFILGNQAGTATVNVIYEALNGDMKQLTIPVTVKHEAVAAQLIEVRDTGITCDTTVTNGVYSGSFNAYEKMDMKVTDNFGIEYKRGEVQSYNFALNVFFNPKDIVRGASDDGSGTVTVNSAGIVQITGDITSFLLTAALPNGKEASVYVTVRKKS
ncbi:S-layer homology domain-containing protein [Paenibacillus konkukensis]|nr:S-layer homology domain-containing protein [Paenibacillus konkukensis]